MANLHRILTSERCTGNVSPELRWKPHTWVLYNGGFRFNAYDTLWKSFHSAKFGVVTTSKFTAQRLATGE